MHPFSILTSEELQQVTGGSLMFPGGIILTNLNMEGGGLPVFPGSPTTPPLTTLAIGEEGGWPAGLGQPVPLPAPMPAPLP